MTEITGGEALVRMFAAHGIDTGFGIGGYQSLPYYDAVARTGLMRHVLIHDEKNGAFAADAYARTANRPAVADATVGPGATNMISGAAESLLASIPAILLTSDVNSQIRGRGATQESEQIGMLAPATKATIEIGDFERIAEQVRNAVTIATSGRPGPVHVNVPEEVFHSSREWDSDEESLGVVDATGPTQRIRPDSRAVERAADILRRARRPVILAGGGIHCSRAYDALARFATSLSIPVATSISGKGAIAETSDLALGLTGRFSGIANDFLARADVIVVVGCKLGEVVTNRWSTLPADAQLIHIDVQPNELGKNYPTAVRMWADAQAALDDLTDAVDVSDGAVAESRREQQRELLAARAALQERIAPLVESDQQPIGMPRLVAAIQRALPDDGILVGDAGFASHWSALYFEPRIAGRCYVANRGHAGVGYGVAGAIGAQLGAPERPVVALCGDNGFAMAMSEMETAKRLGLPITIVVVNNASLGYVKALQHAIYAGRYVSVDYDELDFGAVARDLGCDGTKVISPADLDGAIREAVESGEPHVVDVSTTRDPGEMLPGVDSRTARREPVNA